MDDPYRTIEEMDPELLIAGIVELVDECCPLFSGKHPAIVAGALADLVSLWIAGHRSDTPESTNQLHETLMEEHIKAVWHLIPESVKQIDERHLAARSTTH